MLCLCQSRLCLKNLSIKIEEENVSVVRLIAVPRSPDETHESLSVSSNQMWHYFCCHSEQSQAEGRSAFPVNEGCLRITGLLCCPCTSLLTKQPDTQKMRLTVCACSIEKIHNCLLFELNTSHTARFNPKIMTGTSGHTTNAANSVARRTSLRVFYQTDSCSAVRAATLLCSVIISGISTYTLYSRDGYLCPVFWFCSTKC